MTANVIRIKYPSNHRNWYSFDISMVNSTKVLCPLFDEIEILVPGDNPSIFSQPSIYRDGWLYGMSMTSVTRLCL